MFTLEYAKNPIWNNKEGTAILLTIKWAEFQEEMPFGATSFDPESWGVDLYNRAKAGEFGEVLPFIEETIPIIDFIPTPTDPAPSDTPVV